MKNWFRKWTKWEYWPMWFFYLPIYPLYLWLSLRSKSLTFFTAVNPGIELGGFVNYSKSSVLLQLPSATIPFSLLDYPSNRFKKIHSAIEDGDIKYPLILKPDKGERGDQVKRIVNKSQLTNYLKKSNNPILLQEFIDFPLEFGVMFYKFPGQEEGKISGIVEKRFQYVTGNGVSTFGALIKNDPRASMYLELFKELHANKWKEIIPKGEKIRLVYIGNHCKGAIFYDESELITADLSNFFSELSKKIQGFYFGRFDIKVPSIDDFKKGKNILIMEVNGVNSEPAHIYDPKMPLFRAYKIMYEHWQTIYKIAVANIKKGIKPDTLGKAFWRLRKHLLEKQ